MRKVDEELCFEGLFEGGVVQLNGMPLIVVLPSTCSMLLRVPLNAFSQLLPSRTMVCVPLLDISNPFPVTVVEAPLSLRCPRIALLGIITPKLNYIYFSMLYINEGYVSILVN